MKRTLVIALAALLLVGSSLGCCTLPEVPKIRLPDLDIGIPTVEVVELMDEVQTVPLGGATEAAVEVSFGGGELEIEAGSGEELLSGHFIYNIKEWAPDVAYEEGILSVQQGGDEDDWGFPTGAVTDIRNEWELRFAPEIPLEMDLKVGAGVGTLDFTGLKVAELDIDLGAGDFEVRFEEPNTVSMGRLTLDTGAAKLDATGIGNAGPDHMTVQSGAGEILLDFTGDWPGSADIDITAGVGAMTLWVPDDVGVEIEVEGGLSNVEAVDFQKRGDTYINDALETAETTLHIAVKVGMGIVRLVEVSD
jgi:hypothetical protein